MGLGVLFILVAIAVLLLMVVHDRRRYPTPDWRTHVAAVARKNPESRRRQRIIRDLSRGERVLLVREPDNKKDANAIRVCLLSGEELGYIPEGRGQERLCEELAEGIVVDAYIEHVTGGTKDKPTRGILLAISYPERPRRSG